MRFKVRDLCDLVEFAKFSLWKMFSPKWDKANFEQNHKNLAAKFLILNEITKFSSAFSPLCGRHSVLPFCHLLIALAKAHNKRYCFYWVHS